MCFQEIEADTIRIGAAARFLSNNTSMRKQFGDTVAYTSLCFG
jgi:hypothetical protein